LELKKEESNGQNMQEQTGVKIIKELYHSCFVFAEFWSSESFSLLANGCRNVTTRLDNASDLTRSEVTATKVGRTLATRNQAFSDFVQVAKEKYSYVFLQGSNTYLNSLLPVLNKISNVKIILAVSQGKREKVAGNFQWEKVKHSDVGGILFNSWWIGATERLHLNMSTKVKSQLRDVLKYTVEGEVVPINEDTDQIPFTSQFKKGDEDKLFVCPFVKYKSGKVRRVLTEGELMDIYDVEVSLRMLPAF